MKARVILFILILCAGNGIAFSQETSHKVTFDITVADELKSSFKPDGRLFLFIDAFPGREPRLCSATSGSVCCFAKNVSGWKPSENLKIDSSDGWIKWQSTPFLTYPDMERGWKTIPGWDFGNVPEGTYYLQLLWDQETSESPINSAGNIYSKVLKINVDKSLEVNISLSELIEQELLVQHNLVKEISLQSDTLSKWWGKPVIVKAALLLPAGYAENPGREYPIRYNIGGYGGRYTRVNSLVKDKAFMDWWLSGEAPQIITVFLDCEGPFGDTYQMDSENNGPYGYNLINELIPYIESNYRGGNSPETRFTDGCSTGGWVSLALQLLNPDLFNGCFSYSPDPLDFEYLLLVNIYKDKNAFINEYGYLQPVRRSGSGRIQTSLRDWIQYENVLGSSDSYVSSGYQFGAYAATFGPKGHDGLPVALFDPVSGKIDSVVAESWKKYDLKLYAEKHWSTLGPRIAGKINIWMGDMDSYHLNIATHSFDYFLRSTKDPHSDAVIDFTPLARHCQQYSQRAVLEKINDRLIRKGPTGYQPGTTDK